MRALVIDDDPTIAEMLGVVLGLEGYQVAVARDGHEGLAAARQQRPDVIILDVMMPSLDGWAVADTLREDPELRTIPIVFCTARSSADDVWAGWQLGATSYVSKPFVNEELVGEVLRATGSDTALV